MATYAESGVDISAGDKASKAAYAAAMRTFSARNGMHGQALSLEDGFSGALDMGNFYLVTNCDGVGTKIDIALETQNFDGLGEDLLAMVADDAICVGAEVIAITNTVDTNKVNAEEIEKMMDGLATACIREKIIIPGGEIAELGNTLSKTIWNSSAVGMCEKEKFLTGEKIQVGDAVIALQETGFRANGFSLVRFVMKENGIKFSDAYDEKNIWGEMLLTPSKIYHSAVLDLMGRFGNEKKVNIHGVVHITGGGLAGNFFRILKKKKLGANLPNIFPLSEMMKKVQKLGNVADREAYKTWNCGNGMLIVLPKNEAEKAISLLKNFGVNAQIAGEITDSGKISHQNFGVFGEEEMLEWA